MSKRIDLTIYEGHTKGDPKDNPNSWRVVGDGFVMNGTAPADRYIGYIRHSNFKPDMPDMPAEIQPFSEADANLIADGPLLLAELKKMYAREAELLEALRIIRDDLDEAIDKGHCQHHATNGNDVTKIRNFANDASQ